MNARPLALDVPSTAHSDHEPLRARRRFGAIVRSLAQLADAVRAPRPAPTHLDGDDALPTRRVNRVRRLLGKRPRPGKSRSHARRLR